MDLASVWGIIASLSSFILAIFLLLSTNKKLKKFEDLADNVGQLFRYEEGEDGEVLLDARLGKMMSAFSSGIAQSLKMSMLQGLSVQSKLDKGLKGAIASDVVENQMPMISLIGDVLGINTKKYIANHPDALMQLAPMIQAFMGKIGQNNPGNSSGGNIGYG